MHDYLPGAVANISRKYGVLHIQSGQRTGSGHDVLIRCKLGQLTPSGNPEKAETNQQRSSK